MRRPTWCSLGNLSSKRSWEDGRFTKAPFLPGPGNGASVQGSASQPSLVGPDGGRDRRGGLQGCDLVPEEERKEIESHVTHSYDFLKKIPWTKAMSCIPDIAYAHHEKLNGRGYPRGLHEDEIMIESKMMAIADIFDALTASDRPYKKAAPLDKALQILGMEKDA